MIQLGVGAFIAKFPYHLLSVNLCRAKDLGFTAKRVEHLFSNQRSGTMKQNSLVSGLCEWSCRRRTAHGENIQ